MIVFRTKYAEYRADVKDGERILYAGLAAGIPLPYECATGTCGSCRARVKSGTVTDLWSDAPGKQGIKTERQEILMCQCAASGTAEILVPGKLADEFGSIIPDELNAEFVVGDRLTHDVQTFSLILKRQFSFAAGQFVAIQVPGIDGYRAYSMVNYATECNQLDFVVKRKPGGGFSDRLADDAALDSLAGKSIRLFGPLGTATYRPEDARDLLLIAGGSGIAGMMAILDAALQHGHFEEHGRRAHLFFGVRTAADLFYASELSDFARRSNGKLAITVALSDVVDTDQVKAIDDDGENSFAISHGFVHEVATEFVKKTMTTANPSPSDKPVAYVAGPPPMVDAAIRMLLTDARLPPQLIRYDKFS